MRATRKSGDTFTPVTVMKPMRGSRRPPRPESPPPPAPAALGCSGFLPVPTVAQRPGAPARLGHREVSGGALSGAPYQGLVGPPLPGGHPLGLGEAPVLARKGQLQRARVGARHRGGEELLAKRQNFA